MKCDYCEGEDHLLSACPTKAGARRNEVAGGCAFIAFLAPFYVVGIIAGAIWSAAKAGISAAENIWPTAWKRVRDRKDNDERDNAV